MTTPGQDDDPVVRPHSGVWRYHDDDCLCSQSDSYCNRDGWVWSCCGACKEKSDCSAPHTHPTLWNHPKHSSTTAGYRNNWPFYRTNREIRELAPECFDGLGCPPQNDET